MKLVESRTTLLSNDLKRHLFNLFASWSGPTSKLLGYSHGFSGTSNSVTISTAGTNSNSNNLGIGGTTASGTHVSLGNFSIEEEKLQFSALQVSESLPIYECKRKWTSFLECFNALTFYRQWVLCYAVDHVLMANIWQKMVKFIHGSIHFWSLRMTRYVLYFIHFIITSNEPHAKCCISGVGGKEHIFEFNIFIFDLQVYDLARDIVVLLLESNPDIGQLLEWVIDRCYTAPPREADACFLSLATVFSAR